MYWRNFTNENIDRPMANTLWVNDSHLFVKHQASMEASLAHRLEVARAAHNTQLIALLEREAQQIKAQTPHSGGIAQVFNNILHWWANVKQNLENSTKLSVEKVVDEAGVTWWYAHDPRSGKTLFAETDTEVLRWIEENNLGE